MKIQQLQVNQHYCFNYALFGDRQAPIILFLHGWLGDHREFWPIANTLASNYRCLLVDLPGHGHTKVNNNSSYQMAHVAAALIKLLQKLAIQNCLLIGYSMGGRLALYLSIYWQDYFSGVLLESASPGLITHQEQEQRIQQDERVIHQLTTLTFTEFLQWWYSKPLFSSFMQHPDYQKALHRRLENNPQLLIKSLREMGLGQQPSLWSKLANIQLPIMLVVGHRDRKFVTINQHMEQTCPSATLQIVANCGHNVHFENPEQFLALIRSFTNKFPAFD